MKHKELLYISVISSGWILLMRLDSLDEITIVYKDYPIFKSLQNLHKNNPSFQKSIFY